MDSLLGLALLAGGVTVLIQVFLQCRVLRQSRYWKPTPGHIQFAGVSAVDRLCGLTFHRAKVIYDYAFEGRSFRGDTVLLGGELSVPKRHWAFEHSRDFVATAHVWVWVDPQNPQRCCLRREGERFLFATALGLVFAALGASVLAGHI